ncbi:hypothetical protein ISF_02600 [Cordyceps fumosorosea ARSEF 2679]|uniref:FAD-dependent oxidoreductase-like enzyme n=1 Tax=Cordyceps fumosorosea (strain ARSEF 2679) TaxID=1081104 RepID=A0A168BW75_CORFA|nr:hypothetical protein ISF_02600 [Cordyceps fumosorosea ARSEF 2679]OAA70626.1 hypothetical protein ISF_02600 [Cordyceps fumosorosea ARSEF 2679]
MAARPATDRQQPRRASPSVPTTPIPIMDQEQEPLSQVTLPSTEGPGSPIDPSASFKTEVNDDRPSAIVIPSSLTPPPSSQLGVAANRRTTAFSQSQQTVPVSPPATILNNLRDRDINVSSVYTAPSPDQIRDASSDQLREMLQTCIIDNQKFKMEAAHHKLQYNLLSMQADEESKRAAVEHDMVRRQVDVLCLPEHSRHVKRDFGSPSDAMTTKYLELKASNEASLDEIENLQTRLHAAKKVIRRMQEENIHLTDERDVLLNRIRDNRVRFKGLYSRHGFPHDAPDPQQSSHPAQSRHTARTHGTENQHGLSMILQAISHDDPNNSAPSTPAQPARLTSRQSRRHSRNAQSMSSLPTTPLNHPRGAHSGLLPSADLVPQTEPRMMYSQKRFEPVTPDTHPGQRSRESTISADDSDDAAAARRASGHRANVSMRSERSGMVEDRDVFGSQASQAATDLLRRHPGHSFDMASSGDSRDGSPNRLPIKPVVPKPRSRLPDFSRSEKRRLSGSDAETAAAKSRREQGSPAKKARTGADADGRRVGLGIQYE